MCLTLLSCIQLPSIMESPSSHPRTRRIFCFTQCRVPTIRELALEVRKQLNRPLIAVVPNLPRSPLVRVADRVIFDAGPAEFLGWLKNASFICTNSFHGMAFSLIYRKDFLSVAHRSTNSRSHSLLQQCGLISRQLSDSRRFGQKPALRSTMTPCCPGWRKRESIQ